MTRNEVKDKNGEPIHEGDKVGTKFRGGRREGLVEKIVTSDSQDTSDLPIDVQNAPKVVFKDQHGHTVSHNPGTLTHASE
ncbi:hypothetical protein GLOTRDRAFT_116658 [Gloeophyllum trabeum ATCC 11539]|uniref:Hypervirulence associated protein TUDOR domain-containing protein n=1 Tax=Gloeophyllum trabeum (strain ATCC 11539 / FP-39264 / Madison 617) TaxID=670483 RepID=S7Q1R2_GLOTA|nr:uncharacterized protein GLOTRDRAFT_116658 [Gloeophyllum trabeum ATCC 11539]EPQ53921.1 hypothetical protein GLOTRDRAFT_116658 [Gloeophyllum trabeum ATCC 11539]